MKKITLLIVLILASCNSEKSEELIRTKESINILKTLIEEKGSEMVRELDNDNNLPICLNLKKNNINAKCFDNTKADNTSTIVKFLEKSFTNPGEVCIEKIYYSHPINNSFFSKKDSLHILNQNKTLRELKIPKNITRNFKTVALTTNLKMTKKYVQFSIPIFSQDNTKAYLEFDCYLDNDNSYGNSIYLEKKNGKCNVKYIKKNWRI